MRFLYSLDVIAYPPSPGTGPFRQPGTYDGSFWVELGGIQITIQSAILKQKRLNTTVVKMLLKFYFYDKTHVIPMAEKFN